MPVFIGNERNVNELQEVLTKFLWIFPGLSDFFQMVKFVLISECGNIARAVQYLQGGALRQIPGSWPHQYLVWSHVLISFESVPFNS